MTFAIQSTLETIRSYLASSGYFRAGTQVGEPKAPPTAKDSHEFYGAVFMDRVAVVSSTLDAPIELHTVTIRVYRTSLSEPVEDIEYQIASVVQDIGSDLLGDYDLGGDIRSVDAMGIHGGGMSGVFGYVDVGGVMYRICDISLPLIVDRSATFSK